jgi:hypothetical protein
VMYVRSAANAHRWSDLPGADYRAGTIGVFPPGPGAGGTNAPAGVFELGAGRAGGGASIDIGSGGGAAAGPRPGRAAVPSHAGSVVAVRVSPHPPVGAAGTIGSA